MLLITKELALVVVVQHTWSDEVYHLCSHCGTASFKVEGIEHKDNCIVVRAKLLLEQEWGIKND